jgi:hypothetical protein
VIVRKINGKCPSSLVFSSSVNKMKRKAVTLKSLVLN